MPLTRLPMIDELNELLKDRKIDIPDFRRSVSLSGQNTHWLKKHIEARNPKLPSRVKELLTQL